MGALAGLLRPGRLVVLGLVIAAIASGAFTGFFGLLGVKTSEAKRLAACLTHHHLDIASMTATIGNPATLLATVGDGRPDRREVRRLFRETQGDRHEAVSIVGCLRRVAR